MHDLRLIRDDPQAFDAGLARRGCAPVADQILALDETRRNLQTEAQALQTRRNQASKQIGTAKADGDTTGAEALMAEVAQIKTRLPQLEQQTREAEAALEALLLSIPNLPLPSVPDGRSEDDNVEEKRIGTPPSFAFTPQPHDQVVPEAMDFACAAKLSGARFALLRGSLARLERALAAFMLDHAGQAGFAEVSPPYLVRSSAMTGTGQLPKFADDAFAIKDQDLWLISTAEIPLTNQVAGDIVDPARLPLRFTAHTPCFRSEAGSAGRDTTGMIRLHQFMKVELVSIVHPDTALAELEHITRTAETLLEALGLPYRRVALCAGDLGFGAQKTYDLEVWFPAQNRYREISSCSTFGAFQARRMNARYRDADGRPQFLHTLNGSALAVGRTLAAIVETCQQSSGGFAIPPVLQPYMQVG